MDSCEPKILDFSLVPDVKVRLYMASDNVLTTSTGTELSNFTTPGGSGGARYSLTDIFATIECISLADSTYDNMVASQMSQQGYLECPFSSYQNFQQQHSGSSRFSISAASLNKIWVAWRANDYDGQGPPIPVAGYKTSGAFVSPVSGDPATVDIGKCGYDAGGVLGTNAEKYKSKYFNFAAPSDQMTMQMSLNSTNFPQFSADFGVLAGITQNSLPGSGAGLDKNRTLDQYLKHGCVQCFRLNMADSEYSRTLSGLDTRSSNLAGIITTTGHGANNLQISIFTESTSVLRIGAGRAIEIIA
jgi:hypothetical protein